MLQKKKKIRVNTSKCIDLRRSCMSPRRTMTFARWRLRNSRQPWFLTDETCHVQLGYSAIGFFIIFVLFFEEVEYLAVIVVEMWNWRSELNDGISRSPAAWSVGLFLLCLIHRDLICFRIHTLSIKLQKIISMQNSIQCATEDQKRAWGTRTAAKIRKWQFFFNG